MQFHVEDDDLAGLPKSLCFVIRAGRALYGSRWQSPLARDLGVTYNAVHGWVKEKQDVPEKRVNDVVVLLVKRLATVHQLLDDMPLPERDMKNKKGAHKE